eukprot:Hpha_TRINITY_DN16743_c0_g3::TRINITY_DN16743_c0_g3_i3::g.78844::m.78844
MELMMIRHGRAEHNFPSIAALVALTLAGGVLVGGIFLVVGLAYWDTPETIGSVIGGFFGGAGLTLIPALQRLCILDPSITALGRSQAVKARDECSSHTTPDIIFVSSASRTLQTAELVFPNPKRPLKALDECRELPPFEPCCICDSDHRRNLEQLKVEFPAVDFIGCCDRDVDPIGGKEEPLFTDVRVKRFAELLRALARREVSRDSSLYGTCDGISAPSCVAIVAHDGFLRGLMAQLGNPRSKHISNCELVTMTLE